MTRKRRNAQTGRNSHHRSFAENGPACMIESHGRTPTVHNDFRKANPNPSFEQERVCLGCRWCVVRVVTAMEGHDQPRRYCDTTFQTSHLWDPDRYSSASVAAKCILGPSLDADAGGGRAARRERNVNNSMSHPPPSLTCLSSSRAGCTC